MATDKDIAFPTLRAQDIATLERRGSVRAVHDGEVLFAQGDTNVDFFIVLEGEIEIAERSRGSRHAVVRHQPGGFTGDVDTLSGRAVLVEARRPARVASSSSTPRSCGRWWTSSPMSGRRF